MGSNSSTTASRTDSRSSTVLEVKPVDPNISGPVCLTPHTEPPVKTPRIDSTHSDNHYNTSNVSVTNQNLPYAVKPVNTPEHKPLTKQMSVLMPDKDGKEQAILHISLAGVPFQLNSKYKDIKTLSNFQVPELHFRSLVDIENEYGYDFRIEKTAAARIPPDLQ